MLDASSKIPSGLLEGNLIDLGMYDECVEVRGNTTDADIRGRHCMYSIDVNLRSASSTLGNYENLLKPTFSICLPSSCTAEDVMHLLNSALSVTHELEEFGVSVASASCAINDAEIWDTEFIVCL